MKQRRLTIFRRFAIVIVTLITVLGALFIIITYLATTNYHQASTQLLNKDVAKHVAAFTKAFTMSGINKRGADSVFENAMVLNPNAEVYFLDTTGKVIYYDAKETEIRQWDVDVAPIKKYIEAKGEEYIKGVDPKDPHTVKIFSAAEVNNEKKSRGYIYIILGSKKSDSILDLLFGSHILNLAIKAFIAIILLSLVFSFLYLKRLRKNFNQMIAVLERFENGDFDARFSMKQQDELQPVTDAFNKMADLLSSTINKLKHSEQERKNFIATISHDLRTPLSIARGYTETLMLKRETGDITKEEQENYSQLIYDKMLQIENMVKQLFELSKMEAVEFKPHQEPFIFSEIVQEAVNTFQLMAAEKNVSLSCKPCDTMIWINADISMMERVVQNLVENALKNTSADGAIEATIVAENDFLFFKIKNTGATLPNDLLAWINQFDDENAGIKSRPQKPGLGLLIVQKILHLHKTSLRANSIDGNNVFTFQLPVYKVPS